MKSKLGLLSLLFLGTFWALPFAIVHATTISVALPGVKPDENSTYLAPNPVWQTNNLTAFPNPFRSSDTAARMQHRITAVQGASVTFSTFSHFLSGITPSGVPGALVNQTETLDVQTQSYCVTLIPPTFSFCNPENVQGFDLPLIASGLRASDPIGSDSSILLNQTATRVILGTQRPVNFLNLTFQMNPPPGFSFPPGCNSCITVTARQDYAWDQVSGIEVGNVFSLIESNPRMGSAIGSFPLVITSTNIWTSSDFSATANPSNITLQGGKSGLSTITLASLNGFAGTLDIQASTSSPRLSCSLSDTSVTLSPSDNSSLTISCRGSEGTYGVTVTGTSGPLSHSTTLTYKILHGRRGHNF